MKVNRMVDDLDGSVDEVETRYFGLDGYHYEIDLSKENWDLLVAELQPFVNKATELKPSQRPGTKKRKVYKVNTNEKNREIRAWARMNGWPRMSDRGRLPSEVVKAYEENQSKDLTPEDA